MKLPILAGSLLLMTSAANSGENRPTLVGPPPHGYDPTIMSPSVNALYLLPP